MFNLPSITNGKKFYLGAAVLFVTAAGKFFFPELFANINLLDFQGVEGQGFMAYMLWAGRSALKKLEE